MGAYDAVKEALSPLGTVTVSTRSRCSRACHRASASVGEDQVPIFALPGNPVVASCRSCSSSGRRCGRCAACPRTCTGPVSRRCRTTACARPRASGSSLRGMCSPPPDGSYLVTPRAGQGSHQLAALAAANALIVVPENVTEVAAGRWWTRSCCERRRGLTIVGERLTHVDEPARPAWSTSPARTSPPVRRGRPAGCCCPPRSWRCCGGRGVPKGDALGVARIAGIQGAKRTPDLIPLCHPHRAARRQGGPVGGRRRGGDRRDGPHRRPHRRRDGGADRGRGRGARVDRHGQGASTGARSSPTSGSRRRPAARPAPGVGDPTASFRTSRESTGRHRVQPRGVRRVRRQGGTAAASTVCASWASRSTARRSSPTATRSRRRCATRCRRGYDVVVTTGGTGLTPPDLTPEMTRRVIDREVPGIAEAIRLGARRQACRPRCSRAGSPGWPGRR